MADKRTSDEDILTELGGDELVRMSVPDSESLSGYRDAAAPTSLIAALQEDDPLNTVTSLASTSGAIAVNAALGDYFTHALDENVTSITFSGLPGAGKGKTLMIRFTQDATPRTVAWPASFKFAADAEDTVSTTAGAVDLLAITTFDNGTTWLATLAKGFA